MGSALKATNFLPCNILYTIFYVDDTCAVLSGNDLSDFIKLLYTELCKLSIWLRSNKLSLNINKTFYLLFHRARIKPVKISMEMNGSIINRVNSIKYLGVIIDNKLNWIEHIADVKNKTSKGVGILFRTRHLLCRKSLINLYYSFVYHYLIYCMEAWGSACQLHPLLLTQKKVIRVITFSPYLAQTDPMFTKFNILPLNKIIFSRIGIMMYKYSKGLLPEVIGEMYRQNNDIHSHRTRSRDLLSIPQGTIHLINVSARLWNVLVLKMDVHIALSKFKYNLKVFLLHNEIELRYSK